jgi:hypothetical protein
MNNPYYYRQVQQFQAIGNADTDSQPREALGPQPTKVTLRVSVSASFTVKGSQGK